MKHRNESAAVMAVIVLMGLAVLSSPLISAEDALYSTASGIGPVDNSSSENFTIVVLPDTQGYSKWYPWLFDNQTQWIVNNKEALNIVFVTQLGDLVDHSDNITEWENANRSMSKLDGNVPWAVSPGNHDQVSGDQSNYTKYFGYGRFSGESWYGGAYTASDNANSYQLFSAGGDDYLILHIRCDAGDDALLWASNIIDQYPERRVIVSTHDYLVGVLKLGQRSDAGEHIWHTLIKPHADQIFLVLCGHSGTEDLITDTVNGHVVYQMLADYQNTTNIKSGWLRLLQFCPQQHTISVKTYSPYLNTYKTGPASEFTLDYNATANAEVYIRADGSVEPSTAPIQRNGNVYTLTGDIHGSIVVERSNVVIDGAGFTLQGTGADDHRPRYEPPDFRQSFNTAELWKLVPPDPYVTPDSNNTGIYSCAEKLTVRNLTITEFWCGIEIEYSADNYIAANEITNNSQGIWIHSSSNDTISGNTVIGNKQGITLTAAHENIHGNNITNNSEYGINLKWSFNNITGNNIESNSYGITFDHSACNVLKSNSFSNNSRVFNMADESSPEYTQDVDNSNFVGGKPIYYWLNKQDMVIPADAGWVALVNCTGIKVENLNLAFGQEILLISTANSTVIRNTIATSERGIYLDNSANINIAENSITDSYSSIHLKDSDDNHIEHNNVAGNTEGIYLESSSRNTVRKNDVTRNNVGIELFASSFNLVSENTLTANTQGVALNGTTYADYTITVYASQNNNVSRNNIKDNACGISIRLSSNNTFSNNNFVNNTNQAAVEVLQHIEYASANSWDNNSEGNYWSDYTIRYPDATEPNDSGIWNTPYVIDVNNQDNHPLTKPAANQGDEPNLTLTLILIAVPTATVAIAGLSIYRQKRKKQ